MIRQRIPRQSERIRVEILDGDTVVADRSFTGNEKAEKESRAAANKDGKKKKKAVGSEFYNKLACVMGDKFMKFGATLYPCDLKTRGAYANMDLAGYNYGIWRTPGTAERRPEAMRMWNPVGSGRMSRR